MASTAVSCSRPKTRTSCSSLAMRRQVRARQGRAPRERAGEDGAAHAGELEGLPDDDRNLDLHALRRADESEGRLLLTDDGMTLLSQFGINIGSWGETRPTEKQMRNVLRRVDGVEAKERRARKERAERGYGDD